MIKINVIGNYLPDPFFDNYEEETLTCCDILDYVGMAEGNHITLTFEKKFLKKLAKSHLAYIRGLGK